MGLFDFLTGGSGTKVEKLARQAAQKFGPPENRMGALQQLAELGTPEAIAALLKRFTFAIDPSITDREEKEMILRSVTGFGEKSIQPVRDFLRSSDSATVWALRALSQLQTPTEVVGACVETLEKVGPDYTRDPEKKTVLLKHLLEMEDPRIVPAVIPFLLDPSDDVKISASHILGKVKPPEGKKALIEGMLHEKDHKRVLAAYAEAMALAGYKLDEAERPQVQPLLPENVSIAEDGALVQK